MALLLSDVNNKAPGRFPGTLAAIGREFTQV
jgi:hypothetical protein